MRRLTDVGECRVPVGEGKEASGSFGDSLDDDDKPVGRWVGVCPSSARARALPMDIVYRIIRHKQ